MAKGNQPIDRRKFKHLMKTSKREHDRELEKKMVERAKAISMIAQFSRMWNPWW